MFVKNDHPASVINPPASTNSAEGHRIPPRLIAGGRFLLFALVMVAALLSIRFLLTTNRTTAGLLKAANSGYLDAALVWIVDGGALAVVLVYIVIAARREKRSLSAYGLPLRASCRKQWTAGLLLGFVLASLDIVATRLLGGYSFGRPELSLRGIVEHGLLWGGAFILVGIYEECLYRGYALKTLAEAIGFWPAAVVLALAFGMLHLLNPGESAIGALDVIAYALLASFTLMRTGSLWFAIGVHSAWDFSLTFLFSAPGSGLAARGSLLHSSLHGSAWLTGGTAGPEGSVVGLCVLALGFLFCYQFLPQKDTRHSDARRSSRLR